MGMIIRADQELKSWKISIDNYYCNNDINMCIVVLRDKYFMYLSVY